MSVSEQAAKEGVDEFLVALGWPRTRENYIRAMYMDEVPTEWGEDEELDLPEDLRLSSTEGGLLGMTLSDREQ